MSSLQCSSFSTSAAPEWLTITFPHLHTLAMQPAKAAAQPTPTSLQRRALLSRVAGITAASYALLQQPQAASAKAAEAEAEQPVDWASEVQ
jgi:hypothetical protein